MVEGKLSTTLTLSPALRLRFADDIATGALIPVTNSDFTRTVNALKDRVSPWHFSAVIAFAKDDEEATAFRRVIKEAALKDEYRNIVFIDALSNPLGSDDFDSYVEYSAMAQYYQSNNNQTSKENANKAAQVLSITWRNRIYNGTFVLYYDGCREGEKVVGRAGVASVLQGILVNKHKYIFDFSRGLTENQLKLTQGKAAAKCGIVKKTSGVVINVEKSVLPVVWNLSDEQEYWNLPEASAQNISVIKRSVEQLIADGFNKDGQICIGDIYDYLENAYGFAPCNLSAFLVGFLLKEYRGEPYRYTDASGSHEPMSPDKLAEMIGNYIGKKPNPTYIVKMTPEEKAFYEVTEKAWEIAPNSCSSAAQAGICVKNKMQALGLPVWCLEEVDTTGAFEIVRKYLELVQKEGKEAHQLAITIGAASRIKTSLGDQLAALITPENCQKGMRAFLQGFECGKLLALSNEIGANDHLLKDVSKLFSVQYSSLWNIETGKDQIRALIVDYSFVKISNSILGVVTSSKKDAFESWINQLDFSMCSCESLQAYYPSLSKTFEFLLKIYQNSEILPEQLKLYTEELAAHAEEIKAYLGNEIPAFGSIYALYLEDISEEELIQLKDIELVGIFKKGKTEANAIVKKVADDFKKNQKKAQMFNLWKSKTGSKNPADWSSKHRTPILKIVKKAEYDDAKKTFETLNRNTATDIEIQRALDFLERTTLFDDLQNQDCIDNAFKQLLGSYVNILTDIEVVRDSLERLAVDAYEWDNHPSVRSRIFELAKAEYDAGGSDRVRDELVSSIGTDSTFLCWIDALGVEYLSYIVELAHRKGLAVSVNVGRCDLPTITPINKKFYELWPELYKRKVEDLDDVKHHEKGGYKYGPSNLFPIHLAKELQIISAIIDEAATDLGLRQYDRYVIASDHGASRLAVLRKKEEKYTTDTQGEHSGRCCKLFAGYDLPFATEENGYVVLADYGRFSGSRAANVEVHGGASLEEVLVPVIVLSLRDASIVIKMVESTVKADYKKGATITLFVNKTITHPLYVECNGNRYQATAIDENHYKVNLADIKRACTVSAGIFLGEDLISNITIKAVGKSAAVDSDFDDLF